jgi:nitrite reductase/ring-hydroxylating ferredoxin subunit
VTAAVRSFPFPLPLGWAQVAYSEEVAPGQVQALRCFRRDLVLFRTQSGRALAFDAHCPHLGAHLGHGGAVEGERLRCPFHGWCFDADGKCVKVPYARRIPAPARDPGALRAWPLVERNGMLMLWHHPRGEPPAFEVPALPEYGSPGWTPYERFRWTLRTRSQEVIENSVDRAHFQVVHGTVDVPRSELALEGPRLRSVQRTRLRTPRGAVDGAIESVYYGLTFGWVRFTGICEALLILSFTPVDEEQLDVRFSFTLDARQSGGDTRGGVGGALIRDIVGQWVEDTPIWENKVYHERPVLCDGDGPIAEYRRWAAQFYA